MDPSPSRLAAIATVDQLFAEAGVHSQLKEGVLDALGRPTTVREVAFVSDADWLELTSSSRSSSQLILKTKNKTIEQTSKESNGENW